MFVGTLPANALTAVAAADPACDAAPAVDAPLSMNHISAPASMEGRPERMRDFQGSEYPSAK